MIFIATKAQVFNRGAAPDAFLTELVTWGKTAPDKLFDTNPNNDIYAQVKNILGPDDYHNELDWLDLRRATMLEVMRVHAGFESSWNWREGVDHTNAHSMTHLSGQETGAWQVSFDSTQLDESLLNFCDDNNCGDAIDFIHKTKDDHQFAMEYYVRLMRINISWAGPVARHKIDPWLSKTAMEEFKDLLTA